MKIFIVFIALFLVNMCIISYQSDLGKYTQLRVAVDNAAFECMEAAAAGNEDAKEFADDLLRYTINNLNGVRVRDYRCDIFLEDDEAVVRVKVDVGGLFKVLSLSEVSVTSEKRCRIDAENFN